MKRRNICLVDTNVSTGMGKTGVGMVLIIRIAALADVGMEIMFLQLFEISEK